MAANPDFWKHRHWEDWCSMGIGALILISPVITRTVDLPSITLNSVVVGLLVMLLAWQELILLEAWEEYLELALGLWLMASPWMFGYSHVGLPTATHILLGGLVAALAMFELWQNHQVGRRPA